MTPMCLASRAGLLVSRCLYEIDKGPQRRGDETPPGVVEIRPREALPPCFEDRFQSPAVEMRTQPFFEQVHDAGAGDRGIDKEVGCSADAHQQRPGHVHLYGFTVALELPSHRRPAREPALQTAMAKQIARVLWPATLIQVG